MIATAPSFRHILVREGSAPATRAALAKAEALCRGGTQVHLLRERALLAAAANLPADLIIAGREAEGGLQRYLKPFPGRRLMRAGVPLLTVRPGCAGEEARNLIVAVTGSPSPRRKALLASLCSGGGTRVHLVTFIGKGGTPSQFFASPLLQMYRWLRSTLHCPVEYAVLHGGNPARALFRYAEQVQAGLVLMPILPH